MKNKTTPGPWYAIEYGGYFTLQDHDDYGSYDITDSDYVGYETAEANAKLAASAPDLLAALEEIAEAKGRYDLDRFQHAKNTIEDMQKLAIDAINKLKQQL